MKNRNSIKPLLALVATFAFLACSTAPKGLVSSSADPNTEIQSLAADLSVAQKSNIDVLARKDYKDSISYLNQAREDLAKSKDQERIIDDLRFGRESLNKAYSISKDRGDKLPGLFTARQNAIDAGANQTAGLRKELSVIDDDVADVADKINSISTKDVDKFQSRYVELENRSVIQIQLGKAGAQIKGAENDKAAKRAPMTLRKAQISLKNAETLIGSNVSNPKGFRKAVAKANYDANYLFNLMNIIKENGKSLTEESGLKILSQKQQISSLEENLTNSEDEMNYVENKLDDKSYALEEKEVALGAAQLSVSMQAAMEKSRSQFLPSEAEAYQQGENLLIRLKSINFKSGGSQLPSESMDLLVKVSDVAKSLNAKEIKVIGHTDSIGSIKRNQKLSEQRASAVATYFRANGVDGAQVLSEGQGYEHPIASNKSKAGRALNRRVDIVITPTESSSMN